MIPDLEGRDLGLPQTFEVAGPLGGGPPLGKLRAALAPYGQVRFDFIERGRVQVGFAPGPARRPLLALGMIARSDALGLERTILSVVDEVDEIVIGIDARSDEETHRVAEAFADSYYTFRAADIGLDDAAWAADRIHFAGARNIGRERTRAEWTLFLDSDEVMVECEDMRARLASVDDPEVGAFTVTICLGEVDHNDPQRLSRTRYRFRNETHNRLGTSGTTLPMHAIVAHDTSLRSKEELARRTAQRSRGVALLRAEAEKGNLGALFHIAKHLLSEDDVAGAVAAAEDFRLRAEIHGELAAERTWLALTVAAYFIGKDDLPHAEQWATRALLDGPSIEGMFLLGEAAEKAKDLVRALGWYEAACAVPVLGRATYSARRFYAERFGRRDAVRALFTELAPADGPRDQDGAAAGGEPGEAAPRRPSAADDAIAAS